MHPIFDGLAHASATAGVTGIDTSSWQGTVDWKAVAKAGHQFVYIKASQGTSSSYSTTEAQWRGATAAGLNVGLYHYADPTKTAVANADAFAVSVNRYACQLPPCVDLEVGTGDLSGWVRQFITWLRAKTGKRQMMVYSGVSFFQAHIRESWMDGDTMLWLAHYGVVPGHPGYTSNRVAIHQYSQSGNVPGVSGNCDLDYAMWPLNQLTGDGDLTPEEHQMLVDLHAWITTKVPTWAGGTEYPVGSTTAEKLSPLELLLRNNVETRQTWLAAKAAQQALESKSTAAKRLSQGKAKENPT